MKQLTTIILLIAAVIFQGEAQSLVDQQMDSLIASHKFITFGGHEGDSPEVDSIRSLVENFYYDQFRNSMDPAAPYFMFISKDANLAMGIGGMVRMRGYFDWGGAIPSSGFAPILIQMQKNELNDKTLGTTPAGTALFFRVIGRNAKLGLYQLYIEANFNGYGSRDFHLKKAYATINDWTIGYAASTFSDPAAESPIIDAAGQNAKMSHTAVLVRWMHTWQSRWTLAASVEQPSIQGINSDQAKVRSQWVPDVALFGQYEWGKSAHVRLAGIIRQLPYRDLVTGRNYTSEGWGIQLSTVFHPIDCLTFYGVANTGKGYGSLGGDLVTGNYDLVADPLRPGRAYAPKSWGYFVGLQYNIRPNLYVSTTFSQNRYLPSKAVSPDEYKYGLFSATNVVWNLTPRIQAGIELDLGKRQNFSGDHRWAHRIGALAGFSF
ncbi:MAG: hypothetical protein NC336_07180 [Clostridium sp.]|nr:hypothetical protein [Clostridium sp.]